ncbi:hypothetical protein [Arthrobacter sp. FW306-04-A]|uniref:hypothetical protein n=1 Tax=Arthrobacter sp. FW306-04-A TaxID=2879619 RepID=UPI0037C12009|nr:hypothetical protein LFT43_06445 [Arthrobacter sp. FW306-04-A]
MTRLSGASVTVGAGTVASGVATRAGAKRMHLQHDWVALLGEVIQVRLDDRTVRTGRVDGVTRDGAILWIERHGAESRTMFERCEGFTAWIQYRWEAGPSPI